MKRVTRIFEFLLLAALLGASAAQAKYIRPMGDGMPGPWPFPWAKECPVDWGLLAGRYLLSDSAQNQQLDLKITVVDRLNFKLVRVSRYGQDGFLVADGYAWVANNQKTIRLWLFPLRKSDPPTWAVLKLYHKTADLGCSEEMLVPILSLDQVDRSTHTQALYRLIRVSSGSVD
jgi:hypothetical protein